MNRTNEVNWIRDLALELSSTSDEGTADEIVSFYLDVQHIETPPWFDKHDRYLLRQFVDDFLGVE